MPPKKKRAQRRPVRKPSARKKQQPGATNPSKGDDRRLAELSEALDIMLPELTARIAAVEHLDRKSTRLNSSHSQISYAVFCLKKKQNDAVARYVAHQLYIPQRCHPEHHAAAQSERSIYPSSARC